MDDANNWKFKGNTTQPGNPLFDEYVNIKTGESTLKEYKPRKITSYDTCNHYFEMIDDTNAQCKKCKLGQKIIWGLQFIQDGKIITKKKLR